MSLKFRIRQGFDKAAHSYDANAQLQREVARRLFQENRGAFPPAAAILDAGCGTGYFHELARSNAYKWQIYQLDLAFSMCQVAASYASPPSYGGTFTINGDIEALPLRDEVLDGIFSSLALQWVTPLDGAFYECYRTLKPGGKLVFSTFLPGTLRELAAAFSAVDSLPHINNFVEEEAITTALAKAEFKDIRFVTEHKMVFYADTYALMRSLKNIGASYKTVSPSAPYTRKHFALLEASYQECFATGDGVPASWEIAYITAEK